MTAATSRKLADALRAAGFEALAFRRGGDRVQGWPGRAAAGARGRTGRRRRPVTVGAQGGEQRAYDGRGGRVGRLVREGRRQSKSLVAAANARGGW